MHLPAMNPPIRTAVLGSRISAYSTPFLSCNTNNNSSFPAIHRQCAARPQKLHSHPQQHKRPASSRSTCQSLLHLQAAPLPVLLKKSACPESRPTLITAFQIRPSTREASTQ